MITLDPVYLLFLCEALLILLALCTLLFIRMSKLRKAVSALEAKRGEVRRFLQEQSAEAEAALNKATEQSGEGPETSEFLKERDSMQAQFFQALSSSLGDEGPESIVVWTGIAGQFDGLSQKLCEVKTDFAVHKESLTSELEGLREEQGKLEAQLEAQSGKVEQGEYSRVVDEAQGLRLKIGELEASLAAKTEEVAKMQKDYDSLEQEYLVLYKEQKATEAA